ncbi:MAG: PAS domain-containing protein, partial [Rickettsiales bacterium]|nr:PAS domain-containing protein [Rickettsiales bacterium]
MTTDTMKRERDRFVAFAFAAADILIEMDHHGVVLFADGAISGLLGVSPQALVGQAITDLVIPTDAPVIGNLLTVISKKLRLENIPLSFHTHVPDAPLPMTASAFYYSGMEDHVFLSVTSRRLNTTSEDLRQKDATTGTLNKEAFADIANKRILQAQSEGTELELTLLDLPQLQAVLDGLSTTRARALLLEIGEYLNASSHGGDTATNLGEGHSFSL